MRLGMNLLLNYEAIPDEYGSEHRPLPLSYFDAK